MREAMENIAGAIKPDDCHSARTRLLCLEYTWNGNPMTMDYLRQATDLARSRGLAAHLDGARRIANHFDSVSVCFSKGLGAPVRSAQTNIVFVDAAGIDHAVACIRQFFAVPAGQTPASSATGVY
ncbi:MAG: hypothetical protein KGN32_15800 [Burkholderiales bacterium]|nr:hypothetical protein [Burkholderiales bacterium]